jgi:uncharacterized membrane protein YgcG
MDLSSNRSQDEDRIMQRQLYRAGQNNPPAEKTPAPTSGPFKSPPAPAKAKSSPQSSKDKSSARPSILTPSQRKKALIALCVAIWLLMLGSISYCVFLPDLEEMNHERMALFQDKSLTPEQRREKFEQLREKEKNLTPGQRKQMREIGFKEMMRKRNRDMYDFLKMSPEQQVAYVKKQAAEREKWRKEWEQRRKEWQAKGGGPKGGNRGNGKGGGTNNGGKGGGPGGGGGGPPGGFGGGGSAASLDRSSPESRAGGAYQRALMGQLGLGGGGRGGGPGGGGGGGRGGGR